MQKKSKKIERAKLNPADFNAERVVCYCGEPAQRLQGRRAGRTVEYFACVDYNPSTAVCVCACARVSVSVCVCVCVCLYVHLL